MKAHSFTKFIFRKRSSAANDRLIHAALSPDVPKNLKQLVSVLIGGVQLHIENHFIILSKPYGISCVGYKQKNGGIFENSRYDKILFDDEEEGKSSENKGRTGIHSPTVEAALPFLAEHFNETSLLFCTGMKRYISGPLLLPTNSHDYNNIVRSVRYGHIMSSVDSLHRALAICVGHPEDSCGEITGYATFKTVHSHSEYIFVRNAKAKQRARTGQYAVQGSMNYTVLDYKYGCSLVDLSFKKFARHLPRLMLTELHSPILGDSLYFNRVNEIDGRTVLLLPGQKPRTSDCRKDVKLLMDRLNVTENEILELFPFFFHVYRTKFPQFGCDESAEMELTASSPLPAHMIAMLECLEMADSADKHLRQLDSDTSTKRISSERRF